MSRRFTLTNPRYLAAKAAIACALSLGVMATLGNPDRVTGAFVSVLCCSPGALLGLRLSAEQLVGSAMGGIWGTGLLLLGAQALLGVPVAVGLAILTTHLLGAASATAAAAFTALFVQLVSHGDALETISYRFQAVAIAAGSAFVVNLLVSSLFYSSLFDKRMRRFRRYMRECFQRAVVEGSASLQPLFGHLANLDGQLEVALKELALFGAHQTASRLKALRLEVRWLRNLTHLVVDLDYRGVDEEGKARAVGRVLANDTDGLVEDGHTRLARHIESAPPGFPIC